MYGSSDVGTCVKCGQSGKFIMGLVFNELEGFPFICSQCIYEHFIGHRQPWTSLADPSTEKP